MNILMDGWGDSKAALALLYPRRRSLGRARRTLLLFGLLVLTLLVTSAGTSDTVAASSSAARSLAGPHAEGPVGQTVVVDQAGSVVARVGYANRDELAQAATTLDIWEVDHADRSFIALLTAEQRAQLELAGLDVTVLPARTREALSPRIVAADQESGIPGYPCYRTVEESYADLAQLAVENPTLAQWFVIGQSWERSQPGGLDGYDLYALVLTNQQRPGPKPKLALLSAIHAREYTTAEVAARFAERLVAGYGVDPELTWLLDFTELHLIVQGNPDGRKRAEAGLYWRKNTHVESPACGLYDFGTDLNRNSSFKWNACSGSSCSSSSQCAITYRGASPASEPETQAIEAYLSTIFADRRGPNDDDAAPVDTDGLFISLHSYGRLILYPWGWTDEPAPNGAALQTLARKFGYFTGYEVCGLGEPTCLYLVDGATDDWAYGKLGVASFTYEMGTRFFQSCPYFEDAILSDAIDALTFAMKTAWRPYRLPAGPEVVEIVLDPPAVVLGEPLMIEAIADDDRFFSDGHGEEPAQAIVGARYTLDAPSWISGTVAISMTVQGLEVGAQGVYTATTTATIDTATLSPGRHIILVEAQDATGQWGVPSARFVDVQLPLRSYFPFSPRGQ